MATFLSHTKTINLLYVEDNDSTRVFTLELLNRFFNNITVANNGQEGLILFKEKNINLVITAINMPKIDGIEMSSYIREIDNNIHIILLSAHNETNFMDNANSIGIYNYLTKPLKLESIIEVLKTLDNYHE